MTLHQRRIDALVPKLLKWFSENARDLPWRHRTDPYAVMVSEVMLQQTQVATVIPYFERWMREVPGFAELARLDETRLLKLWEGLGYYSRARNLQRAAQTIVQTHGGNCPSNYDQVLDLPGIGPYTAGAICSLAFNQPRPILDGNVARVLARVFVIRGNPKQKPVSTRFWSLAQALVDSASEQRTVSRKRNRPCGDFNESLMELGALVCTPTKPKCEECPIALHCEAHRKGVVSRFPQVPARSASRRTRLAVFVVRRGARFLVRQRNGGAPNAGFWELPGIEVSTTNADLSIAQVRDATGLTPSEIPTHIGTASHSIMNSRIQVRAYRATVNGKIPKAYKLVTKVELDSLPLSTISRKVLRLCESSHR